MTVPSDQVIGQEDELDPAAELLTWRDVFDATRLKGRTVEQAAEHAVAARYDYFAWNDRIYETGEWGRYWATPLTIADIDDPSRRQVPGSPERFLVCCNQADLMLILGGCGFQAENLAKGEGVVYLSNVLGFGEADRPARRGVWVWEGRLFYRPDGREWTGDWRAARAADFEDFGLARPT